MAETECMGQGLPGDEAGQGFTQHTACICSMYCILSMMQVLWVSKSRQGWCSKEHHCKRGPEMVLQL